MVQVQNRNNKIDILRCLGILLVVLAHVDPPTLILNIRTFDVVALVIISGMTYVYNQPRTYGKYVFKRVIKLLIPTYITISIIFVVSFIMCTLLDRPQLYDRSAIVQSYLFLDGIAYIWIGKVFLMIAIAAPLLYAIVKKIRDDKLFLGFVFLVYCAYAFLYYSFRNDGKIILDYYLFYAIPYFLLTMLGMRSAENERFFDKLLVSGMTCFALIQLWSIYKGSGFNPSVDKFPPRAYYLTYGILVTSILYKLIPNKSNYIILWISQRSFTIYLFHIIVLMGFNMIADVFSLEWLEHWLVKYVFIISSTIFFTFLTQNMKNFVPKKT